MLSKKLNSLVSASLLTGFILLSLSAFLNRQYIYDQFQALNYKPSPEVVSIVDRTSLSDTGKFYLYASHVSIDSAADFNLNCVRKETGNAILGCYANQNIYVYDVNNSALDGIKEVTSVHEMLHAAWDRLGQSDKDRVSNLLEVAYESNKTPDLENRMAYYSRNEAGERSNELHSIVGTEISNISKDLENYYAKFFKDRKQVVSLFKKYNTVFEQLSKQSDELYKKLDDLNKQISSLSKTYEQDVSALSSDINKFNSDAASGNFSSTNQFNQRRSELVARSSHIESERLTINNLIDEYQTKYNTYQQLVVQNQTLNNSIDSHVAPAPSL